MAQATSKGNEAKSKMKHPSYMPTRDTNSGGSDRSSNALSTSQPRRPLAIKCNTKITYSVWCCDAMIKDGRREEMSKFAELSECTLILTETYLLGMSGFK